MGAFEERERGFETRYALGEETRFRSLARRNKLLGLWVAERIGLQGVAASAYADALVEREVGRVDDEALAKTLAEDFAGAKLDMSAHRIARKIEETMARATREVSQGR